MPPRSRSHTVEWIAGIFTLPAYVDDRAGPYRPECLVWMSNDGLVLGFAVHKPGESAETIGDSFRNAVRRPLAGAPHTPSRVRAASPALAEALRRAVPPDIKVICAATPEIDEVAESMSAMPRPDDDDEQTYLCGGVTADAAAALFRAAARLYRAAPWKIVPSDTHLFAVSIPSLTVKRKLISVIGQMGESLGVIVFDSAADFARYLDVAAAVLRGEPDPRPPPHAVLNFDRGAEMSASLRKEIASYRWDVAGPNAYPWIVRIDSDLVARPPTLDEVVVFEAIALGLAALVETEPSLRSAWESSPGFARAVAVETSRGPVAVMLSTVRESRAAAKPPTAKARTTRPSKKRS